MERFALDTAKLSALVLLVALAGCLDGLKQATGLEDPEPYTHEQALLQSNASTIIVEIDFVAGREPSPLAVDAMTSILGEVTGKTIEVEQSRIDAVQGPHSVEQIYSTHRATFDHAGEDHQFNGAVTLHILYLNGQSEPSQPGGPEFQGVYYTVQQGGQEDAVIALLPDYWLVGAPNPLAPLLPDADFEGRYERAVLVHEIGHALGLVGEIPQVNKHMDPNDIGHSENPDSVMHSGEVAPDEDLVIRLRETAYDPVYQFDADDLADLRAFREA